MLSSTAVCLERKIDNMTRNEVIAVAKTNKNIVKWLNNEPVEKVVAFKDNGFTWYVLNDKVIFTYDETRPYARQHIYLRVLKATQKIIDFANQIGKEL